MPVPLLAAAVLSGALCAYTPAYSDDKASGGILVSEGIVKTKSGQVACKKRKWMEDMLTFIRTKNKARYRDYIETRKCLIMRGGKEVKVLESKPVIGVIVSFEYEHEVLWTYWSSLAYER